jgi:hypothetical protein
MTFCRSTSSDFFETEHGTQSQPRQTNPRQLANVILSCVIGGKGVYLILFLEVSSKSKWQLKCKHGLIFVKLESLVGIHLAR